MNTTFHHARSVAFLLLALLLIAPVSQARVATEGGPLVFGVLANGNFATVREQVEENPQLVKARDKAGQTLLHLASDNAAFPAEERAALAEMVAFLLEKGADPNARDNKGEPPLHRVTPTQQEAAAIITSLLAKGADVNLADNNGYAALAKVGARNNYNGNIPLFNIARGSLALLEKAGGRDDLNLLLKNIAGGDVEEVSRLLALYPVLAKAPDAIVAAVVAGDLATVGRLLKNGADVNARQTKTGNTPLIEAASRPSKAVVALLLKNGADPKIVVNNYHSALKVAQEARLWDNAVLLVKAGARPQGRLRNSDLSLESAADAGHVEMITALLDAGENPATGNALQRALAKGRDEAARVLLARGAPVNADGDDYAMRAPLHLAALTGNLPFVEQLLAKGAEINATSEVGDSALALAVKVGHRDVAELLLNKGADPNASRPMRSAHREYVSDGAAPEYSRALHFAISSSRRDLASLLLKKDAKYGDAFFDAVLSRDPVRVQTELAANPALAGTISALDKPRVPRSWPYETSGLVPLHLAALQGDAAVARVLLEAGAKADAATANGKLPLHYAAASGDVDVAELLLARGADAKQGDKGGVTPLHYAAAFTNGPAAEAMSALLVKYGADVNAKVPPSFSQPFDQGAGKGAKIYFSSAQLLRLATALHIAARTDKVKLAEWLLDHGAVLGAEKNWPTPLHEAARGAAVETVALLLKRGADIHAETNGRTPLHDAIAPAVDQIQEEGDSYEQWSGADAQANRFWRRNLAPVTVTPEARATVALLLKNGADPLASPSRSGDQLTPLDVAVRTGDRQIKSTLVSAIRDVNAPGGSQSAWESRRQSALHRAAFFADVETTELLLARGADVNAEDKDFRTPLDEARWEKSFMRSQYSDSDAPPPADEAFLARRAAVAQRLVAAGGKSGPGILFDAISSRQTARVKSLLKVQPALANAVRQGRTPLQAALNQSGPEVLLLILDAGANLNVRNNSGKTPLFEAADRNQIGIVKLLLERAADPNVPRNDGQTMLYEMENSYRKPQRDEIIALLKAAGARSEQGMYDIIRKNDLAELQKRVEADPTWLTRQLSEGDSTLLRTAIGSGKPQIAEYLLSRLPEIDLKGADGRKLLFYAVLARARDSVAFLAARGVDINHDPEIGREPEYDTLNDGTKRRRIARPVLFFAIAESTPEVVSALIEGGADVNQRDQSGMSPLQYAMAKQKYANIATILRENGAKE